jgi:hypothetical protein
MMMMISAEQSVYAWQRETKVLGESLFQCRYVHHKSHMTWPRLEPWLPLWEAGD